MKLIKFWPALMVAILFTSAAIFYFSFEGKEEIIREVKVPQYSEIDRSDFWAQLYHTDDLSKNLLKVQIEGKKAFEAGLRLQTKMTPHQLLAVIYVGDNGETGENPRVVFMIEKDQAFEVMGVLRKIQLGND